MYAVMQRFTFEPRRSNEIDEWFRTRFVPLLRRQSGFAAFYWLHSGDGHAAALGVWDDAPAAEQSIQFTADFIREHLSAALAAPQYIAGEVRIHVTRGL